MTFILRALVLGLLYSCGGGSDEVPSLLTPPPMPVPTVTNITLPAGGTYLTAQNLDFTFTFDEIVDVTGTPRLAITLDSGTVYADYLSGSGSSNLIFRHTVANNSELDLTGIEMVSPLELNGGTIISNATSENANLFYTVPNTSGILVGEVPDIISVNPPANATYFNTQNLDFVVNFDEAVNVSLNPRIAISLSTGTVYADYLSGSGSSALTFRYTITLGEEDLDGINLVSPLELNGGTITSVASSHNANLLYTLPNTSSIFVDALAPSITSVTPPASATYLDTQNVDFIVNWSKNVSVTGFPRIAITLTTGTVYADYVSGSGTNITIFRYTVSLGDEDLDGVLLTSPLELNSGTIVGVTNSLNANLIYTLPNTTGVLVDALAPTIVSVTPPADGFYKDAIDLDFTVNWSKSVDVTGFPRIAITLTSGTVYANYFSGSGSANHIYRYTTGATDNDADGITMISPLDNNSGTNIGSVNGLNAVLTYTLPNTSGIIIDTIAPAAPVLVDSTPESKSDIKTPTINGTTEANASIELFTDAGCTISEATGVADGAGNFGILTSVVDYTPENYYAIATDQAGNVSTCSVSTIQYESYTIAAGLAWMQGSTTTAPSANTNFNQATAYPIVWDINREFDSNDYEHFSGTNPERLTILSAGDYLASLTMPLTGTATRGVVQAEIRVNGIVVDGAITQSTYIRNTSGHNETSGNINVLLYNLSVNDYVEVYVQQVAAAGTVTASPHASLLLEKVDAARTIFSAHATQTNVSTNLNPATAEPLEWIEEFKDTGFTHSDLTNPGNITLNNSGDYLVHVNIPFDAAVARANPKLQVKIDGVLVNGGEASQAYIRNSGGHTESSIHFSSILYNVGAGAVLTIEMIQEGAAGTVPVMAGKKASLFIEDINTTNDVLMLRATQLTGGTNWNPAAKDTISWSLADVVDSSIYTHSTVTNNHQITIQAQGDYILGYNNVFTSTVQRANPRITIEINGVEESGAISASHYIRSASGHNEASGNMNFLLRDLQVGDVITISSVAEANTGTVTAKEDALLYMIKK